MAESTVKRFYESGLGDKLVGEENFPADIKTHLAFEAELIKKYLTQNKYNCLVEVGCMDGRLIGAAKRLGLEYLGIDIVDRYIHQANQKIAAIKSKKFKALNCDIAKLDLGNSKYENLKSKLAVFPFNSFGNMQEPESALRAAFENGLDVLIMSYDTDNKSTAMREEYYNSCNYPGLNFSVDAKGVVFTSEDGLKTYAYSKDHLQNLLQKIGFEKIKIEKFGPLGLFAYAKVPEKQMQMFSWP